MCSFTGASFGCSRSCFFLSGGIELAIACRTISRCTLYFFANPLIVSPAAYPRRISSNSSTLVLLFIPESCHPGLQQVGQIRRSKWAKLEERTQLQLAQSLKPEIGVWNEPGTNTLYNYLD